MKMKNVKVYLPEIYAIVWVIMGTSMFIYVYGITIHTLFALWVLYMLVIALIR